MLSTVRRWLNVEDYRNLLKNLSSLSLVQISNYILPLITLPYLTRVLGATNFGLVMMAQALMIYLTLLTDYGFNLSATKEIASHQNDKHMVSKIVSAVLTIKVGLLCVGAGVLIILVNTVPLFKEHQLLFYLSYLIVVGNTFLPTFLFQGLEKMTFIAIFNLVAKIGFTVIIFIVIQTVSDYYFVHALWGCSYILVDCVAFFIIIKKLKLSIGWPKWCSVESHLKLSFEYFLSRIAIAIYLNANIIVVGLLFSPEAAGYFSGAEKLLFAITTFYAPLIETVYPYVARSKNIQFIKKVLIASSTLNVMGCLLAFFISPIIIPWIFGESYRASVTLFQWMLIVALIHLPTSIIGYPVLGALGYEKLANRSVIIGALVHGIGVLIGLRIMTHPVHIIWLMILSQLVIFLLRAIPLIRIFRWVPEESAVKG